MCKIGLNTCVHLRVNWTVHTDNTSKRPDCLCTDGEARAEDDVHRRWELTQQAADDGPAGICALADPLAPRRVCDNRVIPAPKQMGSQIRPQNSGGTLKKLMPEER